MKCFYSSSCLTSLKPSWHQSPSPSFPARITGALPGRAKRLRFSAMMSEKDASAPAPASSDSSTAKIASAPLVSQRIQQTDTPCIVQMQQMLRGSSDVLSLAQGVVHWQPPVAALERANQAVMEKRTSSYGPDDGLPELKEALLQKLKSVNGLENSSVMVTAGANQAITNVVLTLCDAGDAAVLFVPYYFNHLMAFQMTGVSDIRLGPSDPETLLPDPLWLQETLSGRVRPKVVVLVNPSNPTGVVIPQLLLQRISDLCREAGVWLLVDNTYDYFMYDGREHVCLEADHIINVFSFSKSYGMMGWRVGYIAYPNGAQGLGGQLLKAQDTIPICSPIVSQLLALRALEEGPEWVRENVRSLEANRRMVREALEPLGKDAVKGGEGAIYIWAALPPLPADIDDVAVVRWLVNRHGICTIPGSACGAPGHIRVAFANLPEDSCRAAALRLRHGIEELVQHGLVDGPRVSPPPTLKFRDEGERTNA